MNLITYIDICAGGPGSGCNPEVAEPGCGRPKGSGGGDKEHRMSKQLNFSERKSQRFRETLKDLAKRRKELTAWERENVVPLARAYSEAAQFFESSGGKDSLQTHSGPVGGFTAERAALHMDIIGDYMNRFKAPNDRPIAIVTGGLPGSGKSSSLKHIPGSDKFLPISADDVKQMMPEFNGGKGAPFLHEESDIVTRSILERAVKAKQNIIVDITMNSLGDREKGLGDSTLGRIAALGKAGYEVHLVFTDVPLDMAITRAMKRYEHTGRFVPPDYIRKNKSKFGNSSKNVDSFNEAVKMPEVAGWKFFDNTGSKPELVKQGGKSLYGQREKNYRYRNSSLSKHRQRPQSRIY